MSYWNSARIHLQGRHCIDPFIPASVEDSAYKLRMGDEAFVTGGKVQGKKTLLTQSGDQVIIPPGQFALLLTKETLRMPLDTLGFISIRTRKKIHGLVNVSGFHVDPGFEGRLIFSVYNAGGTDVPISWGEEAFLLWFSTLQGPSAAHTGHRQGQLTIPNEDIMAIGAAQYSPAAAHRRLDLVENSLRSIRQVTIALVTSGLVALFGFLLDISGPESEPIPVRSPTPFVTGGP